MYSYPHFPSPKLRYLLALVELRSIQQSRHTALLTETLLPNSQREGKPYRRLSNLGASILALLRMCKGQFHEREQNICLHFRVLKTLSEGTRHALSELRTVGFYSTSSPQETESAGPRLDMVLMPDLCYSSSSLYA